MKRNKNLPLLHFHAVSLELLEMKYCPENRKHVKKNGYTSINPFPCQA